MYFCYTKDNIRTQIHTDSGANFTVGQFTFRCLPSSRSTIDWHSNRKIDLRWMLSWRNQPSLNQAKIAETPQPTLLPGDLFRFSNHNLAIKYLCTSTKVSSNIYPQNAIHTGNFIILFLWCRVVAARHIGLSFD